MTIYWADTVRHAVLNAYETAVGTAPIVRVYAGAVPADEGASLGAATKLAEATLASDFMEAAGATTAGEKGFSNLPITMTGIADGAASFYRVYAADGTTSLEQGTVATSGGDMTIDNASITTGQTVRITAWKKVAPH